MYSGLFYFFLLFVFHANSAATNNHWREFSDISQYNPCIRDSNTILKFLKKKSSLPRKSIKPCSKQASKLRLAYFNCFKACKSLIQNINKKIRKLQKTANKFELFIFLIVFFLVFLVIFTRKLCIILIFYFYCRTCIINIFSFSSFYLTTPKILHYFDSSVKTTAMLVYTSFSFAIA